MLRAPNQNELVHLESLYDPVKAHDYYEKHKHLKGRRHGSAQQPAGHGGHPASAKAAQKAKLQASITNLQKKLGELEDLIRVKEAALKRDAKSTAKKERAAKDKNKPQSAADKAKAARDAKKYRQSHKQELKNKAKKSGGSSSSNKKTATKPKDMHIADLKVLATKVRGQLAVAKAKLAAL